MRDYLSDFLTPDGGENLETPKVGKAQKAQKSPAKFEHTQSRQGSKGSKGTFDTFDTSPPEGYSKIQALPGVEPSAVEELTIPSVEPEPTPQAKTRPRLGSMGRPVSVRGAQLTGCPYHTCGGDLTSHGHGLYECQACGNWFERLPLEDLGVFVGDLADERAERDDLPVVDDDFQRWLYADSLESGESEWVM